MINKQIELEKRITENSCITYRRELERAKQEGTFSCTPSSIKLIARILDDFSSGIKQYLEDYSKGKAVRSTMAAAVISRLGDVEAAAYITSRVILNSIWLNLPCTGVYKAIGQALEDEFKMRQFRGENKHYYETILKDLNKRGAKAVRKKVITSTVFNKRLAFHLDSWSMTEKFQAGLVLTKLFVETTGLMEFAITYGKKKRIKYLVPIPELVEWFEKTDEKLEVMQPLYLPMICPPKEWSSIFEGGYISPYLKRNKFIKNNSREYLKELESLPMKDVYSAVNHIQNTKWVINRRVLETAKALWEEGKPEAGLPDREDEIPEPYPFPEKTKEDNYSEEEKKIVKDWKRDTYEKYKRNVQKRSIRILTAQIFRIAEQFKDYESIWFPYQMDFRGRLYPIPVLLQPQGSDLSKGLLTFAEGSKIDKDSIKWLEIHGANMYGYDKESYENRVKWVQSRRVEIQSYAENPLLNRGWCEADKPFQFLAFCFEYADYLADRNTFRTHIPVQLDGTCNGLQHYSALLKDSRGGCAVNLTDSDKPHDIYQQVADLLESKLEQLRDDKDINNRAHAVHWLTLGINRKLTKRPVMVLPYGGTLLSCRKYIEEYLKDTYSTLELWRNFQAGENPADCIFKVSVWLSKYLWESIQEILKSAITGMSYLRSIARIVTSQKHYLEWMTPAGLLVRQEYKSRKKKEIKTELYGTILKTIVNIDKEELDTARQLNGICPNFIHSLDAACLMIYLNKCKKEGINSIMAVHDCYGVSAADTEKSARLLREAFIELYREPLLEYFTDDILTEIDREELEIPELPPSGDLDIEQVMESKYFFN